MTQSQHPLKITITSMTILKILAVVLVLMFVYAIRDILILLLLSMVLAAALDPWVDWLKNKGLPRALSLVFIYVVLISVFVLSIALIIPPVIEQLGELYVNFPRIVDQFSQTLNSIQGFSIKYSLQDSLSGFLTEAQANKTLSGLFTTLGSFFGGLFGVFAILVMTFYMVIREDNIEKLVKLVSPEKYHSFLISVLRNISKKLGLWLRSQLILGLIVGLSVYVGLSIIGVEYALTLGLLSAVTELIPYIGPFIGAVPGVLIAFTQAPILGLGALIIYLLVQLLENYLIVPRIMSKAVGISPLMVIIALLIGAKLAGIVGALLAVPVALIISTALKELDKVPE